MEKLIAGPFPLWSKSVRFFSTLVMLKQNLARPRCGNLSISMSRSGSLFFVLYYIIFLSKEWEKEINDISVDSAKLFVENKADLEGPPRQMNFISKSRPAEGIDIPDDPALSCECPGGSCDLKSEKTCCPKLNDINHFPYTRFGKLRISVGVPIFECNKNCKCGPDCVNRVVQQGRKVSLQNLYEILSSYNIFFKMNF